MYRHSAHIHVAKNSLPSPDYTGSDSDDCDVMHELEQKRRQLDEEIAKFKAQKDREFRDFEREIRSNRRQKRSPYDQRKENSTECRISWKPTSSTSTTNILAASSELSQHHPGSNGIQQKKSSDSLRLTKPSSKSKATPPTLSLDPLNISGETVPPAHNHILHTPPTPTLLSRALTRSASPSPHRSPPPSSSETSPELKRNSKKTTRERNDSLNGLFVPSYLPLLDSRPNPPFKPVDLPSPSASEPEHITKDTPIIEMVGPHSASLPSENSFPSERAASITGTNKRAYTEPIVAWTNNLPSALRTTNRTHPGGRKRKHVLFQLADRAIVEPSSSYEEGPSPDLESDDGHEATPELRNTTNNIRAASKVKDQFGRRVKAGKQSNDEPASEDQVGMGMGDLLLASEHEPPQAEQVEEVEEATVDSSYFSPRKHHGTSEMANRSPLLSPGFSKVNEDEYLHRRQELFKVRDRLSPRSEHPSGFSGGLGGAKDGGSGVGFFELDEELDSPAIELTIDDTPDVDGGEDGTPTQSPAHRGFSPEDIIEEESNLYLKPKDSQFIVGSVPINIVRPTVSSVSNSWVGTFGH